MFNLYSFNNLTNENYKILFDELPSENYYSKFQDPFVFPFCNKTKPLTNTATSFWSSSVWFVNLEAGKKRLEFL